MPLPTYPGLRLALPSRTQIAERIEQVKPDAIHIATEGTIGLWTRAYCLQHRIPFTTNYTTHFPEHISARWPVPENVIYAALRRFHAAASVTMVATPLRADLVSRGFANLGMWTRGVDTDLFRPERAIELPFPRPIFACVPSLTDTFGVVQFEALASGVPIAAFTCFAALRIRGCATASRRTSLGGCGEVNSASGEISAIPVNALKRRGAEHAERRR